MRNKGNKITKTKIYTAKDKLLTWLNFSISICFFLLFFIFLLLGPFAISGKTVLRVVFETLILLIIAGILWQYKIKKTTLELRKKDLCINGRKYLYSQIEKYWLGKTQEVFDGMFLRSFGGQSGGGLPPFPETHKMLYIQVKEEIFPYRFDLKNNFSNQEAEEILESLKKSPIKNACGKEYIDFSILWWSMIMILWIALIIFEAFY